MLVVKIGKKKPPKFENADVYTYKEMLEKYKRNCRKKMWATEEGFSLDFDSYDSDLKQSVYVYPKDKETEEWIKKFYNVIEEN